MSEFEVGDVVQIVNCRDFTSFRGNDLSKDPFDYITKGYISSLALVEEVAEPGSPDYDVIVSVFDAYVGFVKQPCLFDYNLSYIGKL